MADRSVSLCRSLHCASWGLGRPKGPRGPGTRPRASSAVFSENRGVGEAGQRAMGADRAKSGPTWSLSHGWIRRDSRAVKPGRRRGLPAATWYQASARGDVVRPHRRPPPRRNGDRLTSATDNRCGSISYDFHGNTANLGSQILRAPKRQWHRGRPLRLIGTQRRGELHPRGSERCRRTNLRPPRRVIRL